MQEMKGDRSQYRPLRAKTTKRGTAVFFEGQKQFGLDSSYIALIPFHVSDGVTIGGIPLEEKYCYDVFGKCILDVPPGGKVGTWVISFVK
jgi:hypothetical protein